MSIFKRATSIVTAAAIAGSMMAGAAFTDVTPTSEYSEAISLLSSLGALKGYPDGTFGAEKDITREEFVKVLYVLMTGSDEVGMFEGVSPFPDVDDERWSAGYINWAKNLGIVVGDPDGNFAPERNVSFAEASKMFVTALGYDATTMTFPYGFIDKAQTIGLFDDVSGMTANSAAQRGDVAQMGSNTLFVEAPRFNITNGTTVVTTTPAEKVFGIIDGTATLEATSSMTLGKTGLSDEGEVLLDNGLVFEYAGNVDELIGSELKIWYKDEKNDGMTSDDTLVNLQAQTSGDIYNFSAADVKLSETNNTEVTFNLGDREITIDYSALANGIATADGSAVALNAALFETLSAASFRLIDNDGDKDADAVYVTEPVAAKVNYYSESTGRIMLSAVLTGMTDIVDDNDNVIVELEEGIEKDDQVFVTAREAVVGSSTQTVYFVVKADVIEGASITSTDGEDFWFDGELMYYTPTVALNTTLGGSLTATVAGRIPSFAVGNSYDLYLDPNGNIYRAEIADDTSEEANMLVTKVSQSADGLGGFSAFTVTGTLEDGTSKTFNVELDDGTVVAGIFDEDMGWADNAGLFYGDVGFNGNDIAVKHNLIRYGLDSDGNINSLEGIVGIAEGTDVVLGTEVDVAYDESQESLLSSTGTRIGYVTSATTIFLINENDNSVEILSSADLPEFTKSDNVDMVEAVMASDKTIEKLVLTKASALVSSASDMVGLVTGIIAEPGDTSSEVVYALTVAANGKIETYKTESMSKTTAIWVDETGAKKTLSDAMNNGGAYVGTMLGYAEVDLDSNGMITEVRSLGKNATLVGNGSTTWNQGIVARELSNGLSLRDIFSLTYNAEPADDKVNTVGTSDNAMVFADDVVFYTVDSSVTDGDLRGSDYVNGSRVTIDRDTDISVATEDSIMVSENIGDASTGIHYFVDYLTEMTSDGPVITAVFIYTESL